MKKALQWICESRVAKAAMTLLAVVLVAVAVFYVFSRGIFDDDDKVIVTDSVGRHSQEGVE